MYIKTDCISYVFCLPSGGKGSGVDCSVIASTKMEKISKILLCVNFE